MQNTPPLHSLFTKACLLTTFLILIFGAGCDDDGGEKTETVCGGHGHLHDDHCHCDDGYSPTADYLSCVPDADAVDDHNKLDVSSDHGHDHSEADVEEDHGHDHSEGDVEDDHEEDMTDTAEDLGPDGQSEELVLTTTDIYGVTGIDEDHNKVWLMDALQDDIFLGLEVYEAFGAPTTPGTVAINDVEANYASCGTCLILQTGCEVHEDHLHCEKTFMPRAEGEVRFDALGAVDEQLTGALVGIAFQEVTIAEDFETTPVENGEVLELQDWTFDTTLESLHGEECGGHGHLHGEECHCDAGYVVDPKDPTMCIPE